MVGSSFVVDRVMVTDGSNDGSKKCIANVKPYGATGLGGGNEIFWPISHESLQISILSLAALSRITFSSIPAQRKVDLQRSLLSNLL